VTARRRTFELRGLGTGELPGDEQLEDLLVVAVDGLLSHRRTPALRAPIYSTPSGQLVELKPSPIGRDRPLRFEGTVFDAPATGVYSRLTRAWPVRVGWVCLALGNEEREIASRPDHPPLRSDAPSANSAQHLVRWLATSSEVPAGLHVSNGVDGGEVPWGAPLPARGGDPGLLVWYARPADAYALRNWLADFGRRKLKESLSEGRDSLEIKRWAWWLSRCTLEPLDVALAAAALSGEGVDAKRLVLRPNLPAYSIEQQDALFDEQRKEIGFLQATAAVTPSVPPPPPSSPRAPPPGFPLPPPKSSPSSAPPPMPVFASPPTKSSPTAANPQPARKRVLLNRRI
jgi:hypothetical protein